MSNVSPARLLMALLAAALLIPQPATAQDTEAMIASAVSAGPASISADAAVVDWSMNTLREGTNGWTCLPDDPNAEGNAPWCIDDTWMDFLHALMGGTEPEYDQVGIAYMLMGDSPICNISIELTKEECGEADWVTGLGAHMMMLIPDGSSYAGMSTDHNNGGPWVMWPGTPYAHLMIPVENR